MATVDQVVRSMINLSKRDGATKATVMRGLKEEFKHVPPRELSKLILKAGSMIVRAQK